MRRTFGSTSSVGEFFTVVRGEVRVGVAVTASTLICEAVTGLVIRGTGGNGSRSVLGLIAVCGTIGPAFGLTNRTTLTSGSFLQFTTGAMVVCERFLAGPSVLCGSDSSDCMAFAPIRSREAMFLASFAGTLRASLCTSAFGSRFMGISNFARVPC